MPESVEEIVLVQRVHVTSDILGATTNVPPQNDNECDDDFEDMYQRDLIMPETEAVD